VPSAARQSSTGGTTAVVSLTWSSVPREVDDCSIQVIGRGSLLSAHRECRSNIVVPVAILRTSAVRPGKESTSKSWAAQNGVAASSKTRKITSLVCMRPIVDSVVVGRREERWRTLPGDDTGEG
jgi:hypothetical protein